MLGQKIKVLLFTFLLVSTAAIPSSNFAYAAGDLIVNPNETVEIDTEIQYDNVRINPDGTLIVKSTGKLTIGTAPGNANSASLLILPGGQLIVEKLDGEPRQNGEVISYGTFLLGTILLDGTFKEFVSVLEKNDGVIQERCGSFQLQDDALYNSFVEQHPDGCAANTTEQNNWILEDDTSIPVEYTVEKNHVLILTGELIIKGVLENFSTIKNITPGKIPTGGEVRNFGEDAELIHICGEFDDGTGGITKFSGEGAWPTEENGDNVRDTICAKPVANDDGNESTPFVTITEDEILNVDVSINVIDNNDFDEDFDPLSDTYDKDIVDFLPELTASSGSSTDKGGIINMQSDGTFTYDPNNKFNSLQSGESAIDLFTYTLDDGLGGTDTAIVTIGITGINDPPVAINDPEIGNISVTEDSSVIISVLENDSDPEDNPLTITSTTNGAIGTTSHDGISVTYTPNPNLSGFDLFTYTISDGIDGTSIGTVNIDVIEQNDIPLLTLNGPTNISLKVGDTYSEQGGTCNDLEDGQIDNQVIIDGDMVDTEFAGVYTVTYDCQDLSGDNAVQLIRTVTVETNDPPVISIQGANPATVTVGDSYLDEGAEASDTEDGDLTANIDTSSTVDTTIAGTYQVSYSVTDSDGNLTTEIRTVNVNEKLDDSLRAQTINEIMELEDLISEATDDKTIKEINKALKDLNKSVEEEKWEDNGNYLIEKEGKKVFNEQQKGVKHMMKILDKEKESDAFLSKITSISLDLVNIDEKLAGNEFTIAEESPDSEQKCLDNALKEIPKVNKELDKEKYYKAIDHLGHFWERSIKCQN